MGFFTSGTDKRIEEIKATVKQLNKDLLILADMVEKGRDYCTLHQLELMAVFGRITELYPKLLMYSKYHKAKYLLSLYHGMMALSTILFYFGICHFIL